MHFNPAAVSPKSDSAKLLAVHVCVALIEQVVKSLVNLVQVGDNADIALLYTKHDLIDYLVSTLFLHILSEVAADEYFVISVIQSVGRLGG